MMKASASLPESELRVNRKWKRFDLKFKYLRVYDLKESLLEAVSALCQSGSCEKSPNPDNNQPAVMKGSYLFALQCILFYTYAFKNQCKDSYKMNLYRDKTDG